MSEYEVWVEPHDTYLRHNLAKHFLFGMWLMTIRRAAAHVAVAIVAGVIAGNMFARITGAWTVGVAIWAFAGGVAVSWALLNPLYAKETYHHPAGFHLWSWWQGATRTPRPPKPGRAVFSTRIDAAKVPVAGMRKQ